MTHNGLICIWEVSCSAGVGETIKGFAVAGFDGLQPCLLGRKPKTCMVDSNESTNAREIQAVGINGVLEVEAWAARAKAWATPYW